MLHFGVSSLWLVSHRFNTRGGKRNITPSKAICKIAFICRRRNGHLAVKTTNAHSVAIIGNVSVMHKPHAVQVFTAPAYRPVWLEIPNQPVPLS